MSDREDRLNELRKARGQKPVATIVDEVLDTEEKSPFKEILEIKKKSSKKKKSTKEEVVTETSEEINTDNLFETDSKPLNKKEEKVEEDPLNE
ncbi:MAG: hypothetical protein ACW98D_18065 [Promethearchaeota archaeon]|jgi:hypothetical protein